MNALTPRIAQDLVRRKDDCARLCVGIVLALAPDRDAATAYATREARRMSRAWGRVRERYEEAASRAARVGASEAQHEDLVQAQICEQRSLRWLVLGK